MNIQPIKNRKDYKKALKEIELIFDAKPDTPKGDRLEVLTILVSDYEDNHYNIPFPTPVDALLYYMESRGLTRQDLEKLIGSRGRVSEILNKKRPLTINMVRRLNKKLGVPAEILIQPYQCKKAA